MPDTSALPFVLRRKEDVVGPKEITSTTETVHGLLLLERGQLHIQWRKGRATERVGLQIRTDREFEAVREVVIPLSAVAAARVSWTWRKWPPGRRLLLTAADLHAFEPITEAGGLLLDHPAQLELRVPRAYLATAYAFAAELELALSELALRAAENPALPDSGELPPPGDGR